MSANATPPTLMTADELWHLPDDGRRYELVEGVLRSMPPAGFEHGHVEVRIGGILDRFVAERGLGTVVAGDPGFVLARGPDTVLAPDVAFVRAERVPTGEAAMKFAELAPDLAVEVASPGDTAREITDKANRWLASGVRLVWVVYPSRHAVVVHGAGKTVAHVVQAGDILDGGDVLPGFEVLVADLFE